MAPEIKIVKLSNGENLIGEVEELTATQKDCVPPDYWPVRIRKALKVVETIDPETGAVDVHLFKWNTYIDATEVEVANRQVVCIVKPKEDFIAFYLEKMEELLAPMKKKPVAQEMTEEQEEDCAPVGLPKNSSVQGDYIVFDSPEDADNWERLMSEKPPTKLVQ